MAFDEISSLRARVESALSESAALRLHETELRMQNEALRELQLELALARDRCRDLFANAPVPYLVLGADSTVLDANAAASSLLQLKPNHLIGRKFSSFVNAPDVEPFARHMRKTLIDEQAERTELSLLLPDNSVRDVRLESVSRRVEPGQWSTALIDVSDLRQLERRLERSQRLEAIGTFTSGLAHDFANLLAVVDGGTNLAMELIDTPAMLRIPLERIKRASDQGRAMVRQLMRFATGPEPGTLSIVKLDTAVRDAETALRQLLGDAIGLELKLGASDSEVCLESSGPEEILLNLASNARHAMPNGGTLVIETQRLPEHVGTDRCAPPGGYALLTVTDSGHGMDGGTQARAFEPFFTTKSPGTGTGLGLAMVYALVKRAGGHIQLSSELGKGTTFSIYLPLYDERGTF